MAVVVTRTIAVLLAMLTGCSNVPSEPRPVPASLLWTESAEITESPEMTGVLDPCEVIPESVLRDMLHGDVQPMRKPAGGGHPGFEIESCGWNGGGKRFTMLTVTAMRHSKAIDRNDGVAAAEEKFKFSYPPASGWSAIELPDCDQAAVKVPPGEEAVMIGLGVRVRNVVIELTYFDPASTRDGGLQRLRSLATLLVEAVRTP